MSKQPCFVCEGDGQVYPFAGKKGIGKECPACKGFKLIDGWLSRCPKCGGDGKNYPFPDKKGIPKDCILCGANGYINGKIR